ncbi:DNA-binding transcriptional MerR regulator [Tamaricihabitans halophyticus]|uniref:DNA-binding transcriptional MerR regulator n=1 Tax=Tamaricihabitans halophyticus TaxID=1262583 RepID=A0A4R2R297_9PSEU|nr:MerR family transcriptional regulator [Tamaricihabitans halophyticus]TCP56842.1 DNA-binding transcriptional MerR regulator [Tamaricihabitans halophyticus]
MAWSTAEVAKLAGVTSRTLRHYDEIGLLRPAFVGSNGYRYYEQEQLLELQQIMVLRELGLGLDAIAEIRAQQTSQLEALRLHHKWLIAERDRFADLAKTVENTIQELEGGDTVSTENLFVGLDRHSEQAHRLAEEAEQRWGGAIESHSKVKGWSDEKWQAVQQQGHDATVHIAELMREGVRADDPRTIEAVDAHYKWICHHWTPTKEAYIGLGRVYVDEPRFVETFDQIAEGLAGYLCEAIAAYAQERLS